MEKQVVTVRMPKKLVARLDAQATQQRRKRSAMLLVILEDALDTLPEGAESRPSMSGGSGAPAVADGRAARGASAR